MKHYSKDRFIIIFRGTVWNGGKRHNYPVNFWYHFLWHYFAYTWAALELCSESSSSKPWVSSKCLGIFAEPWYFLHFQWVFATVPEVGVLWGGWRTRVNPVRKWWRPSLKSSVWQTLPKMSWARSREWQPETRDSSGETGEKWSSEKRKISLKTRLKQVFFCG